MHNALEVDELLERVRRGDTAARDRLITEIYPEIKKIALAVMKGFDWRRGHTLSATALVNQLWLKMMAPPADLSKAPQIDGIPNTSVLSFMIRKNLEDILTDYARARRAQKRPTALTRVDIEQMMSLGEWMRDLRVDALDVQQALSDLEARRPDEAAALKMKYYLGYTIEEGAAVMGKAVISYRRLCESGENYIRKQLTAVSSRKH